jgi:hypothetical protein
MLRAKTTWYLDVGVVVVWIVLPETREVVVMTDGSEARLGKGGRLPAHPLLPGLAPNVADFFRQLDAP